MKWKRDMAKQHPEEDRQFAAAMRDLMTSLRTTEAKYLQRAKGDLPDRKHVIEASMFSLMKMRKIFNRVGGFQLESGTESNLPVHLTILLSELATVSSGASSRLFETGQRREGIGRITHRSNLVRAYSVVLVDLLMEKQGLDREAACDRISTALEKAGFAKLSWKTILDWRKQAHASEPGTKFQAVYDLAKKMLPERIKPDETPLEFVARFSRWLRAHLYR